MKKLTVFLSVTVIIGLTLILAFSKIHSSKIGYEINFPIAADEAILTSTKFDFNTNIIDAQIDENSAFVYQNPKLTDYQIVSDFGFNINDYTLHDDGTRFYKSNGVGEEEKLLKIDQFGCFSYKTGVEHTSREITLTEKECFIIAKQYEIFKAKFIGYKATVGSYDYLFLTTLCCYCKKQFVHFRVRKMTFRFF